MTENQIRETINNFIAAEISDENLAWFPELNADAIRNDPYFHFGEADRHETQESKCYFAARCAAVNLLAVKIYKNAIAAYAENNLADYFDSMIWAKRSKDLAWDCMKCKTKNWKDWTEYWIDFEIKRS